MPSTHLSLNYHIVFSTKNRESTLAPSWRSDLHAYLGGILRDLGGVAQEIGGTGDHVHVLSARPAGAGLDGDSVPGVRFAHPWLSSSRSSGAGSAVIVRDDHGSDSQRACRQPGTPR